MIPAADEGRCAVEATAFFYPNDPQSRPTKFNESQHAERIAGLQTYRSSHRGGQTGTNLRCCRSVISFTSYRSSLKAQAPDTHRKITKV